MFFSISLNQYTISLKGFVIIFITLNSCQFKMDKELTDALEFSGENKTELLKVLDHYKKPPDSLKYKAAIFLIKNMQNHSTYCGEGLKTYDLFFESIKPLWRTDSLNARQKRLKTRVIADSLEVLNAASNLELKHDAKFIKSAFLIENIDLAFEAWGTFPWSRTNVSFEEFCKHILPYKVYKEPVQSWRDTIMKRYRWILDSIKNPNSLREATILINKSVRESMFQSYPMLDLPMAVSFKNLEKGKIGKCEHMVTFNIYLLRAMGIPARVDYVPLWGNGNIGHTWGSIQDENGRLFAFDAIYYPKDTTDSSYLGTFNTIPESLLRNRKAPKIYRNSYEGHYESALLNNIIEKGFYPSQLQNVTRYDITTEYNSPSVNLNIRFGNQFNQEIAYLCVYNQNEWKTISWGLNNSKELYEFKNMGSDIVYLPVSYTQHGVKTISNPFLLTDKGTVIFLNPNQNQKMQVNVDRKYYTDYNVKEALRKMVGGKFQGANFSDFKDAHDLYEIKTIPTPKTNSFKISNQNEFRYLRFLLPDNQCRVAEMKFYGTQNRFINKGIVNLLKGKLISSTPRMHHSPERILDGNVLTYFISDIEKNGWVGIDLGKNNHAQVARIEFYPPNDGNSIEVGDQYELFYWDSGWQSLGSQVAQKEEVTFSNCPDNALFVLRNITKGNQERIFTYENSEQVWW